jgi:hypothetical protein
MYDQGILDPPESDLNIFFVFNPELEPVVRRRVPTRHPGGPASPLRHHGQLRLRLLQHLGRPEGHGRVEVCHRRPRSEDRLPVHPVLGEVLGEVPLAHHHGFAM